MLRETVAFYRRNPFMLVVALVVGAIVCAGTIVDDGGFDVTEIVAVIGAGLVVGLLAELVRRSV